MAKEETQYLIKPFREELILLITAAKGCGVGLDEIESALHCEIDGIKTQLTILNKTKKKKV